MGSAPQGHSRLAPSGASRWCCCPHSAQSDLPDEETKAANDGTEAHGYGAGLLNGEPIPAGVSDKIRRDVETYVAHVLENKADEMFVEEHWASQFIDEHAGTADCVLINRDDNGDATQLAVYDYKNGRWPVKARHNKQLLSYAGIVLEHFPTIEEAFGVIIQPNSSDKETVSVEPYSIEEIKQHQDLVVWAAGSDEIIPGQHCRFCPLRKADVCEAGRVYARMQNWGK